MRDSHGAARLCASLFLEHVCVSPCVCVQKKDKGEQAPSPMRGLEWKYSRERFLAAGVADRLWAVLAGITLCSIGCLRPNVPNHLHSPLPSAKSTLRWFS